MQHALTMHCRNLTVATAAVPTAGACAAGAGAAAPVPSPAVAVEARFFFCLGGILALERSNERKVTDTQRERTVIDTNVTPARVSSHKLPHEVMI